MSANHLRSIGRPRAARSAGHLWVLPEQHEKDDPNARAPGGATMNAALLGLLAALSWGFHDFVGRFPSRAVGPVVTLLAVTLSGFVFLSAWIVVSGVGLHIVWPRLWLVALAGLFYVFAGLALFAALAVGPITIVTPIAGSYPALAVIFAVTQGTRPSLVQWLAIAVVIAGVAAVSRAGHRHETSGDVPPGKLWLVVALSLVTSVAIALSLIAGQAAVPLFGPTGTVWLIRTFSLLMTTAIWLAWPGAASPPLRWLPVLALMGGLDVTAMLLVVAAGTLPNAALATVASSAFGAVAVVLARVFLKERITWAQLAGMVMIFGGVGILASLT
jgi:drug/metabolite transporter (DMT)-like permease